MKFISIKEYKMSLLCAFLLLPVLTSSGQLEVYRPYQRQVTIAARWWCPTAEEISPCICDGPSTFPLLICNNIDTVHGLFKAFHARLPLLDIGKISVSNSRVGSVDRGTFGSVRFQYLSMSKNDLSRVESGALLQSRQTAKRIEIVHGDLLKFPFEDIAAFEKLEHLDLSYNALTSVPDYAFSNNQLKTLRLAFNRIHYVGSFAFEGMRSLRLLDLKYNKLSVVNNDAFAVSQPNPKLRLDLSHNNIKYISEGAFRNQMPEALNLSANALKTLPQKHFESMLQKMQTAKNGVIYLSDNSFQCTCDKISWLLRLPYSYRAHLADFRCSNLNNRILNDIDLLDLRCY